MTSMQQTNSQLFETLAELVHNVANTHNDDQDGYHWYTLFVDLTTTTS